MACDADRNGGGSADHRTADFADCYFCTGDSGSADRTAGHKADSGKLAQEITKQTIWVNGLLRGVYK